MNIVYAMGIGFLLDCMLGDPHSMPHPVRAIGRLIAALERRLYPKREKRSALFERAGGGALVLLVLLAVVGVSLLIRLAAYGVSHWLGVILDGVLFYYCIAPRCLYLESMAVYEALPERAPDSAETDALSQARGRLSGIVGRDTEALPWDGVIRAAVETVAENTSDGVTAPIWYMALGGPVLCLCYRAVNTMDSMLGYHNEVYENFGKAAARLDDLWNYIPARLSAWAMLLGALLTGMNARGGLCVYRRDRGKHKSPNAAQTESVCAGVLGVRLAGNASYFGQIVEKPYIGDPIRPIEREDIRSANRLMYAAAILTLLVAMELRTLWCLL